MCRVDDGFQMSNEVNARETYKETDRQTEIDRQTQSDGQIMTHAESDRNRQTYIQRQKKR